MPHLDMPRFQTGTRETVAHGPSFQTVVFASGHRQSRAQDPKFEPLAN